MLAHVREKIDRAIAKAIVTRRHPLRLDRPTVTFTFDDIPVSAACDGAAVLERYGARATFYICGAIAGETWDLYRLASLDLVADLARRGHDIGCHTATHGRLGAITRTAFLADIDRNAAILAAVPGVGRLQTFAYPFGAMRLDAKFAIQTRFRACRGIHDGLNTGSIDLGRIRADPLERAMCSVETIDALLDEAVGRNGWRVFYCHDVSDTPTRFGITPELLDHAVRGALDRGCAVRTMSAALDAAGVP